MTKKKKRFGDKPLNFKLLRIYFIPVLVIVVAMGVYFFVFLGIKNDILPKTQRLHHDNLQQTRDPMDSLLAFLGIKRGSSTQSTPKNQESPATSNPPSTPHPKEPQEIAGGLAQAKTPKPVEPAKIVEQPFNASQPKQNNGQKQQESAEYVYMSVQVPTAVVRSAPSTQSPPITTLSSGRRIEVTSFDDEWFRIKEPIGGYIAKRLVGVAESGAQQAQATPAQPTQGVEVSSDSNVYEVLANRVNVRSAPNTNAPIIASLSLGQTVRVSALSDDGWATITLDSGKKAYIVSRAIRKI